MPSERWDEEETEEWLTAVWFCSKMEMKVGWALIFLLEFFVKYLSALVFLKCVQCERMVTYHWKNYENDRRRLVFYSMQLENNQAG